MNRVPVTSSNLVSVGYDPQNSTLEIEFSGGSIYQYFDVPQGVYDELLASSSHGQFFSAQIKGNYRFAKL